MFFYFLTGGDVGFFPVAFLVRFFALNSAAASTRPGAGAITLAKHLTGSPHVHTLYS